MDPEEINKLAKELADAPGTPLWAKALAKSGAAGMAAKFLNAHPELKKALIDKGVKIVENANVSGGPNTTASKSSSVASNTDASKSSSTASNTGSYTADDTGYNKFINEVKSNPDILKQVVYVNDGIGQIFVKQGNSWIDVSKNN